MCAFSHDSGASGTDDATSRQDALDPSSHAGYLETTHGTEGSHAQDHSSHAYDDHPGSPILDINEAEEDDSDDVNGPDDSDDVNGPDDSDGPEDEVSEGVCSGEGEMDLDALGKERNGVEDSHGEGEEGWGAGNAGVNVEDSATEEESDFEDTLPTEPVERR